MLDVARTVSHCSLDALGSNLIQPPGGVRRRRDDLTDFEWGVVAPLLPNKPRGVPWFDDRR
ncbi:hypothetical protein GR304_22445 [Microvirga sp. SYSU G3D207]|uniref:Transposase n=1 Tax=Microvirga arsenatis TaxID=2692265 RepID=A0ABW9Z425_9HYPH|nr:hypothetical protein [Microvirga arsenatis]NBJ27118.1 hypothetical protein [Microvirga arsenatis]